MKKLEIDLLEEALTEAQNYNKQLDNTMDHDQEYWFHMGYVICYKKYAEKIEFSEKDTIL